MHSTRHSLLTLLLCTSAISHAQIVNLGSLPEGLMPLTTLASGPKLIEHFGPLSTTVTIYELDLTVYRVLTIPPAPADYQWSVLRYVTEDLFDDDPSTIEYTMQAALIGGLGFQASVYREDGTLLLNQSPGVWPSGGGGTWHEWSPFISTADGTYMVITAGLNSGPSHLFQLPGNLPCLDCHGMPVFNGTTGTGQHEAGTLELFPNPAGDVATLRFGVGWTQTVVSIELFDSSGRRVLRQRQAPSGSATIPLHGLAPGTYQCVVTADGRRLQSLPLVVAR